MKKIDMENKLLDALYKEREELFDKLKTLNELIAKYGGDPYESIATQNPVTEKDRKDYPKAGTWKEKILFVMAWYDKPVVVSEIADKITELESISDPKDLKTTLGQYCSLMGNNNEIDVDKSGYRNKYSLKKK